MNNLQLGWLLGMKYWPLAASAASDGDKDDFASDKDVFSSCEVVRSVTDEGGKKIEARPPRPLPFLPLEPNGFCRKKKKKEIKNMKRKIHMIVEFQKYKNSTEKI